MKGFAVYSQETESIDVFTTLEDAIKYMEEYSGIKRENWDCKYACYAGEDSDDLMFIYNANIHEVTK